MREIKFRAWDKDNKRMKSWEDFMSYPSSLLLDIMISMSYPSLYANGEPRNSILQQFTGLKDKNGKDIYEGDILKYWKTNLSKVVFEFGSFVAKDIKGKVGDGCGGSLWTNKEFTESECEVIGNIYENNNLLK